MTVSIARKLAEYSDVAQEVSSTSAKSTTANRRSFIQLLPFQMFFLEKYYSFPARKTSPDSIASMVPAEASSRWAAN